VLLEIREQLALQAQLVLLVQQALQVQLASQALPVLPVLSEQLEKLAQLV